MPHLAVVENATLQCDKGSAPGPLSLPDHTIVWGGIPVARIHDHLPGTNIPSFGTCKITGQPCTAITPSPWENTAPDVGHLPDSFLLVEAATLKCQHGGVIRVEHPGQDTVLYKAGEVAGPGQQPIPPLEGGVFSNACWQEFCGSAACALDLCAAAFCVADACGGAVIAVDGCTLALCGGAAGVASLCHIAFCGAAAGGGTVCAVAAGGVDVCGGAACGGAVCGVAGCHADACGGAGCGVEGAGVDACLVAFCGAEGCFVDLTPVDACPVAGCFIDFVPVFPFAI